MPPNDAVTQGGVTCPLNDYELVDARERIGKMVFPEDYIPHEERALVLAAVAAERERLREVFVRIGSEGDFDEACQTVDANRRRA